MLFKTSESIKPNIGYGDNCGDFEFYVPPSPIPKIFINPICHGGGADSTLPHEIF